MQFRAEQYYQASLERMRQARELYDTRTAYALAMYYGGLAVESLLRAFRWTKDPTFEGRHDLSELLKASRLLKMDEDHLRSKGFSADAIRESGLKVHASMTEVIILWHNNLRFASEASLKAHLTGIRRVQGIKGDALKKNARDLLEAAQAVVNRGMVLWTSGIRP